MKTYYLTLSQVFPSTHPRAGEPTFFRDKLHTAITGNAEYWNKLHTIRANYDYWAKRFEKIYAGEAVLSIREWIGKPYGKGSTQREIVRLTKDDGIGIQKMVVVGTATIHPKYVDGCSVNCKTLARNDGLSEADWIDWFERYDLTEPLAVIHFTKFRY